MSRRMMIAVVAVVLAGTVAVPTTVALAHRDGEEGADKVCFEFDELGLPSLGRGERPLFDDFEGGPLFGGELPFGELLEELGGMLEEFPIEDLIAYLMGGGEGPFGFFEEFEGELPEDLEGLLDEGGPLFGGELPLDGVLEELGGMLEEFPIEDLIAFLMGGGEGPFGFFEEFEGELPFGGPPPPPGGRGPFDLGPGEGVVCVPTPAARAETLRSRAARLLEAMRDAGLDVGTESIEVVVPVWDEDDPAVTEFLRDYLTGRPVSGPVESGVDRVEFPLDLGDLTEESE